MQALRSNASLRRAPQVSASVDAPSFEVVYRRHVAYVRRVLRSMGLGGNVDDATQEVFVVVYRRLEDFDGRHAVTTWLYEIARRVASHNRRASARERVLRPRDDAENDTAGELDPVSALERRNVLCRLQVLLTALGHERGQLIVLADIAGCSVPEIAALTNECLSTVYTRLRRAREALRTSPEWVRLQREV